MADPTPVDKQQEKAVPPPAPRTAVLVFHGIGDQRPMETMLGVANAVLGEPEDAGAIGRWIKPYVGKDGFFDLKSVSTKAIGGEGRRYDFFELYWADQMSGTRLVAVLLWLCDLAKRDRSALPRDATWLWYAVVGLMTGAMMATVHLAWVIGLTLTGTSTAALQQRAVEAAEPVAAAFLVLGAVASVVAGFCLAKGVPAALAVFAAFAVLAFVGYWNGIVLLTLVPVLAGLFIFLGTRAAIGGMLVVAGVALGIVLWGPFLSLTVGIRAASGSVVDVQTAFDLIFLTVMFKAAAPWLLGFLALFLALAAIFLVPYVGDCARYLRDAPDNIEARNRIRQLGLEVLTDLHQRRSGGRPRYDRIVVVSHSLGTVIAYDVLRAFFVKQMSSLQLTDMTAAALRPIDTMPDDALRKTTFRLAETDSGLTWEPESGPRAGTALTYQAVVRWAFEVFCREQRTGFANGLTASPWRISDFVTLGSPLTLAALLLTDDGDPKTLGKKVKLREFPVAPPAESPGEKGRVLFREGSADDRHVPDVPERLQHSAMFALTCWTNLYFSQRFVVKGDFIGGPINDKLSPGTVNVPLRTTLLGGYFNHTHYWKREPGRKAETEHIRALALAVLGEPAFRRVIAARASQAGVQQGEKK
ncbi:hypothetical protein [Phreatobacter cathodiphilus]|uniref:Uncharacterized protein n=1 Tax=Phreatobacter cathodiphilus TaxID=1868589 RepID=A0A2S0NDL5_9HYPH|nr:hypothetical protein [Phreatobacter cathodiphilus]AVO46137.1 hypothetical protein C6569_14270 [Phreatobacter cathodiphilus]